MPIYIEVIGLDLFLQLDNLHQWQFISFYQILSKNTLILVLQLIHPISSNLC
jgi:hypothetical protein